VTAARPCPLLAARGVPLCVACGSPIAPGQQFSVLTTAGWDRYHIACPRRAS
jgi:hypothetical protein